VRYKAHSPFKVGKVRRKYGFLPQKRRASQARNQHKLTELISASCLMLIYCLAYFIPRRLSRYVPPKRRFASAELHDVNVQNTALFTVTTVKTLISASSVSILGTSILFFPPHALLVRSSMYRMFQKKLYNFESLYNFFQRTCTEL
jgi:hypothetical protein